MILLLLTTGLSSVRAEEALPAKLQKLTDEAYRSYSARETEKYFETVKKVKDATEFSQYQETYYRACSYEAIYMFEYVDRKKGVQLAHDIYHHAKSNNSNVGMYFATFSLGTIREQSGNMGLAEKSFLQALKLKEKYLPEESAAPCYLGLCEVALHRKDYEEVKEYARRALDEAENSNKEQFGDERLQALLKEDLGDARQTSETIHKAVEDFVGNAEPNDDLTKMCIKMR